MSLDYRTVVGRALASGLAAGVALSLYLLAVVEPVLDQAIDLETAHVSATSEDAATHTSEKPRFTRDQQVAGGMAATCLYGVLAGLILGTVYAAVRHRLPGGGEARRVLTLAAVAFASTALVPALKYPANPPGVGDPDTVQDRSLLYLVLLASSVAAAVALFRLSGRLRVGGWSDTARLIAVTLAALVVYGLLFLVLPGAGSHVDSAVPAELLWRFRIRSLGGLALLWTVLGLGLGWALERVVGSSDRHERAWSAP
jgi:predicted cobalt transporter CbtA